MAIQYEHQVLANTIFTALAWPSASKFYLLFCQIHILVSFSLLFSCNLQGLMVKCLCMEKVQ